MRAIDDAISRLDDAMLCVTHRAARAAAAAAHRPRTDGLPEQSPADDDSLTRLTQSRRPVGIPTLVLVVAVAVEENAIDPALLFFHCRRCALLSLSTMSSSHIFLTGNPGSGKTTLLVNVVKSIVQELAGGGKDSSPDKITLGGFYTTECRGQGDSRIGFDIIRMPTNGIRLADIAKKVGGFTSSADYLVSVAERAPLARIGKKGSGPMVGKYVVDVESIKANAIPSVDPTCKSIDSESNTDINLVLLDEVGKMEILCPGFLEAVNRCLDCERTIVFGTIPTPRYGHVIKAVEDIHARPDTTVVYVTKSNRDELRSHVRQALLSALQSDGSDNSKSSMANALSPYLYHRDIDAP